MALSYNDLVLCAPIAKNHELKRFLMIYAAGLYVEKPLILDVRFDLGAMVDANARLEFRFDVEGVRKLEVLLGLPAVVITQTNNRVLRDEAMCILLRLLAYPCRYFDLARTFWRSTAVLCNIFLYVINFLYGEWKHLLFMNFKLIESNMERYCAAIANKGAPLSNVYGFIDGSKLQVCRIKSDGSEMNLQKQIYSGHKRFHCLNYQAVTAPDGICIHFYGPIEGRKHDTTMLRLSGLLSTLSNRPSLFYKKFLYGDPAYGVSNYLLSGFKGNNLSEAKRDFNKWMSKVRQSVEWNFQILKTLWQHQIRNDLAITIERLIHYGLYIGLMYSIKWNSPQITNRIVGPFSEQVCQSTLNTDQDSQESTKHGAVD